MSDENKAKLSTGREDVNGKKVLPLTNNYVQLLLFSSVIIV